jgi:hypothetical protein
MSSNRTIPPIEQVRAALVAFTAAHEDAERKIAAAATLKLAVGANESERKERKASTPAEDYAGYVLHLAEAEKEKAAAVAHLERVEKLLNVSRELLIHDTANINRAWAEIACRTAEKYSELQMQPPARVILNTYPAEPPF